MELRPDPPPTEQPDQADTQLLVDATTDDVWDAITTDDGIAPWLGNGAAIDARPGGCLSVPDPVTERPRQGRVHTVRERKELGFVWWPADDPTEQSDVAITVTPAGPGTLIRITETLRPATAASMTARTARFAASIRSEWAWRGAMLVVSRSLVVA